MGASVYDEASCTFTFMVDEMELRKHLERAKGVSRIKPITVEMSKATPTLVWGQMEKLAGKEMFKYNRKLYSDVKRLVSFVKDGFWDDVEMLLMPRPKPLQELNASNYVCINLVITYLI